MCAGRNQRRSSLTELCESGWLELDVERSEYSVSSSAPVLLMNLSCGVAGPDAYPFESDDACEASIAALRRKSCRLILKKLEEGPMLRKHLRDELNLGDMDSKVACTILTQTYAVREVVAGRFERTGHGFPALNTWLESLKAANSRRRL